MASRKKRALDLQAIRDHTDFAARAIAKHQVEFTLNPEFMTTASYPVDKLSWSSVRYGLDEADDVPNDQRGVYAFVVAHSNKVLPMHSYVVYVGIGGKNSSRTLRDRYGDYLNTRKILKRDRIARMIGTWSDVLHFAYAPVPATVSSKQLIDLEQEINSALLPPFSPGDRKAHIKKMVRMYDD